MNKKRLANFLRIIFLIINSCVIFVFLSLYLGLLNKNDFLDCKRINALILFVLTVLVVFSIIFIDIDNEFISKIILATFFMITFGSILIYGLKTSGLLDKFSSIDAFREYISNFGNKSTIIFIIIQFLQVVFLPIPSFVTVGAGVLLFGPIKSAFFSFAGILFGSLFAFYFGKIFGYKAVTWLFGSKNVDKILSYFHGKDKFLFTFMFLFPFFPDDLLCFVAGIIPMDDLFFCVMITICRFVTVFLSSLSIGNKLIPYNTWWGILIWIVIVFTTIFLIYKFLTHKAKKHCK